jgi:gluconokinase
MGTSSAMRVVVAPEQVEPEQGLWLYYVDRKRALLGGALSEGGNMLVWLKNTLQVPDLAQLDQQLASMEPAAHGLAVLPQIGGERSPGWHPHAAMTITGVNLHTTPNEIARASLEAVIFQLGEIYDQLSHVLASQIKHARLIANGGALLKFSLLSQLLADVINHPLELSESSEASSRGAALLALEALKIIPDLEQLTPEATKTIQPDAQRYAIYGKARERQQALYKLMFARA